MDDPRFPLLAHLPAALIRARYAGAPGNEIASGKLASPRSSAALAANAWGLFIDRPHLLPELPGVIGAGWPARSLTLEALAPFPWRGGRKPCLDVWIETETCIVGIESKRYEPFDCHTPADWSEAYWRPVWGERMGGYMAVRDRVHGSPGSFTHLDAAQLIKHAFGLRTAAHRSSQRAVLFYVFAEPGHWPSGETVAPAAIALHREEIKRFAEAVSGEEVAFCWCSYADLLQSWLADAGTHDHARAVLAAFNV